MLKSSAVFMGSGSLLVECAEHYLAADQSIAAVVSRDARIVDWARHRGLLVLSPDETLKATVASLDFDYFFSVANLELVPPEVFGKARRLAVNFHDSLLPGYAGLNATSWALINRETAHGITWHEMTAKVDAGRIVRQVSFPIAEDETAFSLNTKCYEAGSRGFAAIVQDLVADRLELREQAGERSYFGRHRRPGLAGTLDFDQPAESLLALVRGLSFGPYPNTLAKPKIHLGDELVVVRSGEIRGPATAAPGTVVLLEEDAIGVATPTGDLVLRGLATAEGRPIGTWAARGLAVGSVLPRLPANAAAIEERLGAAAKSEPFWSPRLHDLTPVELPYPRALTPAGGPARPMAAPVAGALNADQAVAAFVAWLSRIAGQGRLSVTLSDPALTARAEGIEPWSARRVPLTVEIDGAATPSAAAVVVAEELRLIRQAGPYPRDLPSRLAGDGQEQRSALNIGIVVGAASDTDLAGHDLLLAMDAAGTTLVANEQAYGADVVHLMAAHLGHFMDAFQAQPERPIRDLPLIPPAEQALLDASNATGAAFATDRCVHQEIAAQATVSPDRAAVICQGDTLTYRELDERASALARALVSRGIARGSIVGLCLERSLDLVVALFAIHKAGGAYLPLDPNYPHERIRFMLEDAQAPLVVTSRSLLNRLNLDEGTALLVEAVGEERTEVALPDTSSDDLAYLIYTSGSTGRPKGVMVSHRNVLNFFAGMDARIPRDPDAESPGIWLAVTSLSFDISVLELCWTLARGFTVVLHSDAPRRGASPSPEFSLFYFASDEGAAGDKYRLLIEGAKFADREGFEAVWTPERHFHAFGGLYPNAAIASAAIATITERVAIRAGSCVLPLHNPIRVAEDWALVDNLSRGRVGVSFASGWQPNDFVLAPEGFATRKEDMLAGIETVRKLWRGESISCRNPMGKMVDIRTLPRPVQKSLPIWLTAAGNPDTFRQAGELGCHLLTHLLGQSVDEVADKIRVYRQAWRDAGHPGEGRVSLMLHTFIGDDEDAVRETVRGPMKEYLRSSVDLIKQAAWTFPTFVQRGEASGKSPAEVMASEALSDEDMDALLEHAFARYYHSSGLFGTAESCLPLIGKLKGIGIDEIACLIDFGIESETVLRHLADLKRLKDRAFAGDAPSQPASIPDQIAAHGVTHFQCTPSQASMLVADAAGRAALSRLQAFMVGGEALPLALAQQVRALVPGAFLNMYGPTETTIWSSTADLTEIGGFIPLGRPIANTQIHVLNPDGQECPALVAGEMHIGGEGVTPGYRGRPELNGERFIPDPRRPGARLYRTGDLVRRHPDGALEFLGRIDHQVKIRGHRIELGEIEAALQQLPGVKEAVVVAREEGEGDKRLVGYVTARTGTTVDTAQLRQELSGHLPEIMVPSVIVSVASLPLTPNGKVDRRALPSPHNAIVVPSAAPESAVEKTIAAIWCEVLGMQSVGATANFFDLGGHSLLVVQVQRRLKEKLGREIAITDMFRFSTIQSLAGHLEGAATAQSAMEQGLDRANARKAMLMRRQQGLLQTTPN